MEVDKEKDWFKKHLMQKGIDISEMQEEQFHRYYQLLLDWNKRINLTSITDKTEVYEKHFYDSLTPSFHMSFTNEKIILDIGSGAGFPSFPIKIIYPHLSLVVIDSLKKRLSFLEEVVKALNLTNVALIHGRAEELGRTKKYRDEYPIVMARAVAPMNILLEYTVPFVKEDGYIIAMKGKNVRAEIDEAKRAFALLNVKIERNVQEDLPITGAERHLIWIRKEGQTPEIYPRGSAVISKKPL